MADSTDAKVKEQEETEETTDPHDFDEPESIDAQAFDEPEDKQTGATEGADATDEGKASKQDEGADANQETGNEAEGDTEQGEFSADLLKEAQERGFSDDEAKSFGSPDNLQKAFQALDRQLASSKSAEADDGEGEDTQTGKQSGKEGSGDDTGSDEFPETYEPFTLELDEEEVYPELAKPLNALTEHVNKALGAFHSQIDDLRTSVNARQAADFEGQMDNLFSGLGESFEDTFGKGAAQDLRKSDAESPQLKARQDVVGEMDAIAEGSKRVGRSVPPISELFKRAVRSLHGDKYQDIAREELTTKLKERSGQAGQRPGGREPTGGTAYERAAKAVSEKLRSAGASTAPSESFE